MVKDIRWVIKERKKKIWNLRQWKWEGREKSEINNCIRTRKLLIELHKCIWEEQIRKTENRKRKIL